jgi:putative transposase
MARKPYPSDLSDKEWKLIEPTLAAARDPRGRKQKYPLREIANAIFYVLKTGCQWRYLPQEYPDWNLVHKHFRKWCKRGTWEQVLDALNGAMRKKSGAGPVRTLSSSMPRASKPQGEARRAALMAASGSKGANGK